MVKETLPVKVPLDGFSTKPRLYLGSRTGSRYQPTGLHFGDIDEAHERHSA